MTLGLTEELLSKMLSYLSKTLLEAIKLILEFFLFFSEYSDFSVCNDSNVAKVCSRVAAGVAIMTSWEWVHGYSQTCFAGSLGLTALRLVH